MILATKVGNLPGKAWLLRLSEPVRYSRGMTEYVVVEASEDYPMSVAIYASSDFGRILDGSEMAGSFLGGTDLAEAVSNAGWKLVLT